jgi:UTP--glucose-1-phosphate uridylyltransferase
VIPAAGLGTRCLPLTKAIPKELLPILDRPGLELIVDEAVASGVDTIVLVTAESKPALEAHFEPNAELEALLTHKPDILEAVRRTTSQCQVISALQDKPLGLGHAVGCAEDAVGNEPFAVMLPDDLVFGAIPALSRLIELYEQSGKGIVLLQEVPQEDTERYGVVQGELCSDGTIAICDMVEKPRPEEAPSNLAIVGRYVFPGGFCQRIRSTKPGALGEIQLTDAMRSLAQDEGMIGVLLSGDRIDTGSPDGLFEAALYLAAREPSLRSMIRRVLNHANFDE